MRVTVPLGSLAVSTSSVIALAVSAAWPAATPAATDEADGAYMPFQDMLDSVAPCEANTSPRPGDGELYRRFVFGTGCVAGGHDDIDGDGHLDCWLAQHTGAGGAGGGTFSVQPRCRGDAIRATWSWRYDERAQELHVPARAGAAMAHGIARFMFGRETVAPSGALAWQIDALAPARETPRRVGSLTFDEIHRYMPQWQPGAPTAIAGELWFEPTRGDFHAYATNPRSAPVLATRCARWDVYTTDGAIAVADHVDPLWSWVFVGGFSLTGELRGVTCANSVVVFRYDNQIGVIDPIWGRWAMSEPHDEILVDEHRFSVDGASIDPSTLAPVLY